MNKILTSALIVFALAACQTGGGQETSAVEAQLGQIGLQNVAKEIPGVEVYMVYATPPYRIIRGPLKDLEGELCLVEADKPMVAVLVDCLGYACVSIAKSDLCIINENK